MSISNILQPNEYAIQAKSISINGNSPLSVYSAENLNLTMTYEDGSTGTYACKIERVGNVVNFYVPYNSNVNGTVVTPNRFFTGGQIPSIYWPTSSGSSGSNTVQYGFAYASITNLVPSTTRGYGVFDIKNNGAFDLYSSPTLASPTNGYTVAFFPMTYTWSIA